MSDIQVRLVELKPIHAAGFLGFGENPEQKAWQKLLPWAKSRGLLENPERHRLFGFNNPNPSPGNPNYGYEVWIELEPNDDSEGAEKIVDFPGGLYAVTRCEVPKGRFEVIGDTWKELVAWLNDSTFKCGHHQWLEESLPIKKPGTEFILDLYLPVTE